MNILTKNFTEWMNAHPKIKEWVWFVVLWCGGLFTVMALTYPIKLIIKNLK